MMFGLQLRYRKNLTSFGLDTTDDLWRNACFCENRSNNDSSYDDIPDENTAEATLSDTSTVPRRRFQVSFTPIDNDRSCLAITCRARLYNR